jgi:cephalosporin hydroxylase
MSWADIPGFSGFLPIYQQWVAQARDGDVAVEVGVAIGHSLAYLARQVIDSGKRIEVWGIDPWAGFARNGEQQQALGADGTPGDFTLFLRCMLRSAPAELERVRIVRATSTQASALFSQPGFDRHGADLVLIDGAHDYDSVLRDIRTWLPVMRVGGWLCGDDHESTYPGVERACAEVFGAGGYEVIGTAWKKVIE